MTNSNKDFEAINYDDKDVPPLLLEDDAKKTVFDAAAASSINESGDINMEEFFRIHGKDDDQSYSVDNPFKTEIIDDSTEMVSTAESTNRCDTNNGNDNNRVFDDELFKQLQESMSVLNDLMY